MTKTKTRRIRQRTRNAGSCRNPRKATIRMTERESGQLASIQGLCHRYGKRERLTDLWRKVAFPAIKEYVKPYAERAKAERMAKKERANG